MFLEAFVNEFNIDMQNFNYSDYFDSVPLLPFGQYFKKLFTSKENVKLSLKDLANIVDSGKWLVSHPVSS